jgi:hypothetical protein
MVVGISGNRLSRLDALFGTFDHEEIVAERVNFLEQSRRLTERSLDVFGVADLKRRGIKVDSVHDEICFAPLRGRLMHKSNCTCEECEPNPNRARVAEPATYLGFYDSSLGQTWINGSAGIRVHPPGSLETSRVQSLCGGSDWGFQDREICNCDECTAARMRLASYNYSDQSKSEVREYGYCDPVTRERDNTSRYATSIEAFQSYLAFAMNYFEWPKRFSFKGVKSGRMSAENGPNEAALTETDKTSPLNSYGAKVQARDRRRRGPHSYEPVQIVDLCSSESIDDEVRLRIGEKRETTTTFFDALSRKEKDMSSDAGLRFSAAESHSNSAESQKINAMARAGLESVAALLAELTPLTAVILHDGADRTSLQIPLHEIADIRRTLANLVSRTKAAREHLVGINHQAELKAA